MNTPQTQSLDFLKKATAVKVSFGNLSFTKKLPQSAVKTESSPDRISASKRLLDCEEAEAIRSEFNRLRKFITNRTVPTPFGDGIYFVPNTRMDEVDAELALAETQTIPQLGEQLIQVLDEVLQREREALGPNFNEDDYDTPDEIRRRLKVDYAYMTFGVPETLPNAMYNREQNKARAKLSEAVDNIQALLRSEFQKLIEHAAEKLAGKKDDGKPLVFKNTLVTNIKDFLQIFKDRNITDDAELEALCDKVNGLLEGVDPQDLRDKEPLRESMAQGFQAIREQLDQMMVAKASRSIQFEDEEAPAANEAAA